MVNGVVESKIEEEFLKFLHHAKCNGLHYKDSVGLQATPSASQTNLGEFEMNGGQREEAAAQTD